MRPSSRTTFGRVAAGLFVTSALALAACSARPQTGYLLVLSSQIPIKNVVLRVTNGDGSIAHCAPFRVAQSKLDTIGERWPVSIGLQPGSDSALEGTVRVVALAYAGDADETACDPSRIPPALVRAEAHVSYVEGAALELALPFTLSCVGVACPEGQTCRGGTCRSARREATELSMADGEVKDRCFSVSACNSVDELVADGAPCSYALPQGVEPSAIAPFVRFQFDGETKSGVEFLGNDDFTLPTPRTLKLSEALCRPEVQRLVVGVGIAHPCASLGDKIACGEWEERTVTVANADGSSVVAPKDGAPGSDSAGEDASRDGTSFDATAQSDAADATAQIDAADASDASDANDANDGRDDSDGGDGASDSSSPSDAGRDGQVIPPPTVPPTGLCDETCCSVCRNSRCDDQTIVSFGSVGPFIDFAVAGGWIYWVEQSGMLVRSLQVGGSPLASTMQPAQFSNAFAIAASGNYGVVGTLRGGSAVLFGFSFGGYSALHPAEGTGHRSLLAGDSTGAYVIRAAAQGEVSWVAERIVMGSVTNLHETLAFDPSLASLTPVAVAARDGRLFATFASVTNRWTVGEVNFADRSSRVISNLGDETARTGPLVVTQDHLVLGRAVGVSAPTLHATPVHAPTGPSFAPGVLIAPPLAALSELTTRTGTDYVVVGERQSWSFVPIVPGAPKYTFAQQFLQIEALHTTDRCVFALDMGNAGDPLWGFANPYML